MYGDYDDGLVDERGRYVHPERRGIVMDMAVLQDDAPRCDTPDPDDLCRICKQATMVWVIEGELRANVCLICDRMVG